MTSNSSGSIDYSKLKPVPEGSVEAKLFQIIDDIDTASDMLKPKKEGYEKYIYRKIDEAKKHVVSDGEKFYYVK